MAKKRDSSTTGAYGAQQLEWACNAMKTDVLRTVAFQIEWFKWVRYRRDVIGKPATEHVVKRTIPKLEEWGHDRAIAAIRHSMDYEWVGIFEPGGPRAAKRSPTRIEARPGKYTNVRVHKK